MQLTEAETKRRLASRGIICPQGELCDSPQAAQAAAERLGTPVAVKSQARRWGRGKAGLVRRCESAPEAAAAFAEIRAADAAGPSGAAAGCLVERWTEGGRELYAAEIVNPELRGKALLLAPSGGVDIETMRGIERLAVPVATGVTRFHARRAVQVWGLPAAALDAAHGFLTALDRTFSELDGRLLELNPVTWSDADGLLALDAKLVVDDNAIARHPDLVELDRRQPDRDRSDELRAEHGIEYVELDGDVGLISGGAGMTMAVMDLIGARGGRPRSFLDCSQNATPEGYGRALDLLEDDERTRSIVVNVVGGGTEVDTVAHAFVALLSDRTAAGRVTKPIHLRLEGTNADAARQILADAGLPWFASLEEAVDSAIAARGGRT